LKKRHGACIQKIKRQAAQERGQKTHSLLRDGLGHGKKGSGNRISIVTDLHDPGSLKNAMLSREKQLPQCARENRKKLESMLF